LALADQERCGAPQLSKGGPLLVRDGDDVTLTCNVTAGEQPIDIEWFKDDQVLSWTQRVKPLNSADTGSVGVKLRTVGPEDEGSYVCRVSNRLGEDTAAITLLVDYPEQRESEVTAELCNCPMLDPYTPVMSWGNSPCATPRRTPLPTPLATPTMTPRATPRLTPRSTPTPGQQGFRKSPGFSMAEDFRSPSRSAAEDFLTVPPRKKYIQAPEIYSPFSNKQADEGSLVELKCFLSCAPITSTAWEKDNVPILPGPNITLAEKAGVRTLIINSIKPGDAGSYKIIVTNASGSVSCAANVSVRRRTTSTSNYFLSSSSRLSVPRSPYDSLGRSSPTSYSRHSSSSYSSYTSYRSYL